MPFNLLKSELRYCNSFWNARTTNVANHSSSSALTECLASRCADLSRAIYRLKLNCFSPRCSGVIEELEFSQLYTLRPTCCVDHPLLKDFDAKLREGLSSTCNVTLTDDQWLQASLPVRNGGLGLRWVSSLASSAFLASSCCGHTTSPISESPL